MAAGARRKTAVGLSGRSEPLTCITGENVVNPGTPLMGTKIATSSDVQDENDSKIEYEKIKSKAEDLKTNKRLASKYHKIFGKGGVTYIQMDKWIIAHFLRCNMTHDDYNLDKKFVGNLEIFNKDINWIRSYCGWKKIEIN